MESDKQYFEETGKHGYYPNGRPTGAFMRWLYEKRRQKIRIKLMEFRRELG